MAVERARVVFSKRVMSLILCYLIFFIPISADNNLSVPDSANGGMGSSASFKDGTKIEHVLDWPNVVKKYYAVVKNNAN